MKYYNLARFFEEAKTIRTCMVNLKDFPILNKALIEGEAVGNSLVDVAIISMPIFFQKQQKHKKAQ